MLNLYLIKKITLLSQKELGILLLIIIFPLLILVEMVKEENCIYII
uniref:Uncharacterized protein n=1 Tax=viral metagenome TaxID=1070528 RepID=A0A6C0BKJ4_9ZZZZ